jgi:hypothetical protein
MGVDPPTGRLCSGREASGMVGVIVRDGDVVHVERRATRRTNGVQQLWQPIREVCVDQDELVGGQQECVRAGAADSKDPRDDLFRHYEESGPAPLTELDSGAPDGS